MRLGFVTCVQLGLEVLDEILERGSQVDAIVTLRDDLARSKSGRVFLDDMAQRHGASLHKTRNINDHETLQWLDEQGLDLLFIIGWSQIASSDVLSLPRRGCLGMHPTLLPEGRGRASIPWAIIKNLDRTGVTLFELDEGVDTGPILDAIEIPLSPRETASMLYLRVVAAHRELIARNIDDLMSANYTLTRQDESRATVWPARRPSDGNIRSDMTLDEVDRLVRALTPPYPNARWRDEGGRKWRVLAGTTGAANTPGLKIPTSDGVYSATVFELANG